MSGGKDWMTSELIALRHHYPKSPKAEVLAALPGRTWSAIENQAKLRHMSRTVRNKASSHDPVMAQVLARMKALNFSVRDLVEEAELGNRDNFYKWLKGEVSPTLRSLYRINKALGLRIVLVPEEELTKSTASTTAEPDAS